jgi:SAM-dependent methyltransferase
VIAILYAWKGFTMESSISPRSLSRDELRQIAFWQNSPHESPNANSLGALASKFNESRVLLEKLKDFSDLFSSATDILELGAGQCWASCMIKRQLPAARVVATDLAPAAVASAHKWERLLGVKLDQIEVCKSYATPFPDNSFDLVFAFSAAHHFGDHEGTLKELRRLLRPGGSALYFHEPSSPRVLYPLAYRRVNAKGCDYHEDVLIPAEIIEIARRCDLRATIRFAPTVTARRPLETIYYLVLSRVRFLQRLLPCTIDVAFVEPNAVSPHRSSRIANTALAERI